MPISSRPVRLDPVFTVAVLIAALAGSRAAGQMPAPATNSGESIKILVDQAIGSINAGNLLEGSALLKGAILLRQGEVLRHYPQPSRVSEADLAWGRQQVEQLLRDRPPLREIVDIDDKMGRWLSEGFAGAFTTARVAWNSSQPDNAVAGHSIPSAHRLGSISVGLHDPRKNNEAATAERILGALCYEILNMGSAKSQDLLFAMATNGDIEKSVFVQEALVIEMQAVLEVRAFYAYEVLPYLHEKGLGSDPNYWYVASNWFTDQQAREIAHRNKDGYPWVPYGQYYDNLRSRGLRREAEAKEKE